MSSPINPEGLPEPSGFSYAIKSFGESVIYFAGHVAVGADGKIDPRGDWVGQFRRILENLKATADAAGARHDQIVKLQVFVTDVEAYKDQRSQIGQVYRAYFKDHYPAMTLVEVSRLWDEDALLEIDAVAVL